MEVTERLPLKPIHWLLQLSYSEFVEQCLNKDKKYTKEECKTKYSILQQFCQTNLKTSGITKRIYSYATEMSGRLFSGGSLQGLPSTIHLDAPALPPCLGPWSRSHAVTEPRPCPGRRVASIPCVLLRPPRGAGPWNRLRLCVRRPAT